MYQDQSIAVIIPVLNEEQALGQVLGSIPNFVDRIIVCDNGSTDGSVKIAEENGAEVVHERNRGYGAACLKGISQLSDSTDIIVFLDGDYSDYPEEMNRLLDPIVNDGYEAVIGSRMIETDSRTSLAPIARFGNWLSTSLIRLFWGYCFTDLGPFRAITFSSYKKLEMADKDFGWTVELQIKAAKLKLKTTEVGVSYRERIGQSKISGTISGSFKAGCKILYLIFRELVRR